MSKSIGFRCPDEVSAEIERKMQLTGLDKTTIILEMIKGLPSINVEDRKTLPQLEAIYLVWTDKELLYIGQTANIKSRFLSHHRLIEFLNCNAKVAWFNAEDCDRLEIEGSLIEIFAPKLNGELILRGLIEGQSVRMTITIKEDLLEQLKIYSESQHRSASAQISVMIEEILRRDIGKQ